jgi:hypothetical protein
MVPVPDEAGLSAGASEAAALITGNVITLR